MKRILIFLYFPLAILYVVMSIIYPTDPVTIAAHHLTANEARLVALSGAIPLTIIWFLALFSSWRLKAYGLSIRQYKDGPAFIRLATGLQFIAIALPIRAVVKIVLNYIGYHQPKLLSATNLVITYLGLILLLTSFILVSHGARKFYELTDIKTSIKHIYGLVLVFCILGATYCHAAFSDHILTPSDWLINTQYDIAMPLRILTIIVPYLFIWLIGLLAAGDIYNYQRSVKGVFYRHSFKLLAIGLVLQICTSIFIQFITTIAENLIGLPTIAVMSIAYCAFGLMAASLILIIRGIKNLEKYGQG